MEATETPYLIPESTDITVNVTSSARRFNESEWWFGQIFPIFIMIFGTIGNFLTVFLLRHPRYRKISTCYYMKALAWSDNFVMVLLFIRWLSKVPGTPMVRDTAFCILYFFFVRFGFGMSAWTLMFMTVDRFISVRFPLRAGSLCTIRRARISLVCIAFVHIVGHLPYFWRYSDPTALTLSQQCPYNLPKAFSAFYKVLRIVAFDRFLPWLLTLGFTIAMTIELYRDIRTHAQRLGAASASSKEKLSRRVTTMSLIVSWIFFLMTFPTSIDYIIRSLTGKKASPFLYELFVYFLYLNSAVNFYLYLTVSARIRSDFKSMILHIFGRKELPATSSSRSTSSSAYQSSVKADRDLHVSVSKAESIATPEAATTDTFLPESTNL